MSKEKKAAPEMDSFQAWAHKWGRFGTVIALIYMIALPFRRECFYHGIR